MMMIIGGSLVEEGAHGHRGGGGAGVLAHHRGFESRHGTS